MKEIVMKSQMKLRVERSWVDEIMVFFFVFFSMLEPDGVL